MRLRHIYIKKYKNLEEFTFDFNGDSFIDVFVGKNGTGKSNFFEALLGIFRQLYENDYFVEYEFKLEYELLEAIYFIHWNSEVATYLKKDGSPARKISKKYLPDNILIYYSGHNEKVSQLINEYLVSFRNDLKEANEGDTREFIGIGKEYKSLLLGVLLLQPEGCRARQLVLEKLGIAEVGNEVKIVLKRPYYAKKNGYNVDRFDASTRFWKAQGITLDFLDKLATVNPSPAEGVRDEGHIAHGQEEYKDIYNLFLDLNDFRLKLVDLTSQELFRSFDNLKTIEMLSEISLNFKLNDGSEVQLDQFSDGQFQSIYIFAIIELFKDKNCLTLLDEPDAFLHPEWQFKFLKQIFEIADESAQHNHVIMTSHSAITLIPHSNRNINLFKFSDDSLKCYIVNKNYAIDQLSSRMIKYKEDEQIISIINNINLNDKPILFTEGSTDPIILNIAWNKLYQQPIPFHILYAFNSIYLRQLLQDQRILNELNGKPAFGIFDFDEAYNEWNYLRNENDELLVDDPYLGLTKKIHQKNSFAIMLPVPVIEQIENQVISDKATKTTFGGESEMEIEHIFYNVPLAESFFVEVIKPGGGRVIDFKKERKTQFAKNFVPKVPNVHFEVFRPIFEFIRAKC